MSHISKEHDDTEIPLAFSKCNETFQTDSEYVAHYNAAHAGISSD
jgi:uncharacterized C2H2 Zn-finger protein